MIEYQNTYYYYGSHIVGAPGMSACGVQPQPLCSQGTRVPGPRLLPGQQCTKVRVIMIDYECDTSR